jgi:Centrosomin N-terminal motif 1
MAVKMARMAATIQQLQQQNMQLELKLASSEERVQAVPALELQIQALESTNTELCTKNTQLQRSLRNSNHSLWESWSEANDLEAQQDEHLKQVLQN